MRICIFLVFLCALSASAQVTVTVIPNGATTNPYAPLLLLPGATERLYANVCNGANSLDCTRPGSIATTWATTCGTLSATSGPYIDFTAPASGGPCTITATSNSVNGTAVATLASPSISIDVIPHAITLYKNQVQLVQAVVVGSVNRGVSWSLTTNPGSAGTLTSQGWTATFSASAAGTYIATVTSSADGSKTATVKFFVTANAYPGAATANHTEPIDCTATGSGTTYEVGPARAFTTINAVPWYTLVPGDTVRIHNDGTAGNPTVYAEKWNIRASGTAAQPIRICGVAANNELPVISGNNATTSGSTDYGILESYAAILIYDHTIGNANYGAGTYPNYITIEGLKITNVTGSFSYNLKAGGTAVWQDYSSAIWMQHGAHITLRGLDVEDTANSIFTNAAVSFGENSMTRWLLMQGNYIGNNGVSGNFLRHQTYAQAFGQVIQGNYYDEPKSGMQGSQVKTRCTECFIRYNYVTGANAGARIFDMVAPEGSNDFTMVQNWYYDANANIGVNDTAAAEDWYTTAYVYGNIVKFSYAQSPFHYADDNCAEDSPGGTLYFYHNTIWENVNANYRWYLFDTGPGGAACFTARPINRWPQSRFTNNAIKLSSANTSINPFFNWAKFYSGFVTVDKNWISNSWGTGTGEGVDGDGTAFLTYTAEYQTGNDANHVTGTGNLVTGTGYPFDQTTYVANAGGPLVGAAASLPAAVSSNLPVTMQYSPTTYLMTTRVSSSDIGAVPGLAGLSYVPSSISFNPQIVSTTSSGQFTDITNGTASTITLTSEVLQTGTQFAISANTCGGSLAASATCRVTVTFTPTSAGSKSDNIVVTSSGAGSPQSVPLSGTGLATPVISPGTGSYSGSQTVSITDATAGTTIYYTIDGSTPTSSSTLYSGSFLVAVTTTVKAIAYLSGIPSSVDTETLTITGGSKIGVTLSNIKLLGRVTIQ